MMLEELGRGSHVCLRKSWGSQGRDCARSAAHTRTQGLGGKGGGKGQPAKVRGFGQTPSLEDPAMAMVWALPHTVLSPVSRSSTIYKQLWLHLL